jgi:hypothetical protein
LGEEPGPKREGLGEALGRKNIVWAEENEVWAKNLGRKISGGKKRSSGSKKEVWAENPGGKVRKFWAENNTLGEKPGRKNPGGKKERFGRGYE